MKRVHKKDPLRATSNKAYPLSDPHECRRVSRPLGKGPTSVDNYYYPSLTCRSADISRNTVPRFRPEWPAIPSRPFLKYKLFHNFSFYITGMATFLQGQATSIFVFALVLHIIHKRITSRKINSYETFYPTI